MEKLCLNCRVSLGAGRPDRKFCDYQCRSIYHYEHTPDNDPIVRSITRILRKNRKIMLELNPSNNSRVTRQELLEKGFDFNYHTAIYVSERMEKYFYCFEMGYICVNDKMVVLVRKGNDVETEPQRVYKSATTNQRYLYVRFEHQSTTT